MERYADPATSSSWCYLIVGLSLAALTLGRAKEPTPAPPLPAVTIAEVPEREITEWDEFTGRLEAVDQVEIRPRVSGYIKRVTFAEGKEVKKGEVLFEIDPRPYQADLARAEGSWRSRSAAALAESEVEREVGGGASDIAGGVR